MVKFKKSLFSSYVLVLYEYNVVVPSGVPCYGDVTGEVSDSGHMSCSIGGQIQIQNYFIGPYMYIYIGVFLQ